MKLKIVLECSAAEQADIARHSPHELQKLQVQMLENANRQLASLLMAILQRQAARHPGVELKG